MPTLKAPGTEPTRPAGAPWQLNDYARWLKISDRHLAKLIADGKVRTILIGRRRFIPADEAARIAAEGTN